MRRYIKTMREQFDNNSVIFKEAKKMFHYVPGNAENRSYGKAKQQKSRVSEQTNQFKDDFSSVKELKNESNDVNESSWIAKLVNGIQEHSLEDVKVPLSKEFKARLSAATVSNEKETKEQSKSIKSDNVIIITG